MATDQVLVPAAELVRHNEAHFPNESEAYRRARNALLEEEIELRRHIERVAEQRRALPPGGEVTREYRFHGENGPASFAQLFADRDTLIAYSFMYGPQRERPCPMCTALLASWDGAAPDVAQRAALAVIARSPLPRLIAFKQERGWKSLKIYSDITGEYSQDYYGVTGKDEDIPAFNIFTRRDGTIRHFWSGEMSFRMSDPGQDPRGAPDLMPLWTILDSTPEGRGTDWYPKLDYDNGQ